jgi:hypothetical protein
VAWASYPRQAATPKPLNSATLRTLIWDRMTPGTVTRRR